MEVDRNKLRAMAIGYEAEGLKDGSVRLVKYRVQEDGKELLTVAPARYGPAGEYTVRVNLPSKRVVEAVINIIKSSANCFKVMCSKPWGTEFMTFGTYSELNEWLIRSDDVRTESDKKPRSLTG